ncbi:MAG: 2'-5' RNA ligase family protein [Chitinophagaceae bacterium]
MQQDLLQLPGYRVSDYQLVLVPHEELRNRIIQTRKEFSEKYKTVFSRFSKPYLPLVYFTQYEMMEERILNRLRTVGLGQYPFRVEFRDFGSFPSHSININVPTKLPVQDLVKRVREETQRLMKFTDEHKPHFITEPYVNIASKLKPWQYEKGWLEYSHLHFTGKFIADKMLLLKKRVGDQGFRPVQVFDFENMPVNTKQGELFR